MVTLKWEITESRSFQLSNNTILHSFVRFHFYEYELSFILNIKDPKKRVFNWITILKFCLKLIYKSQALSILKLPYKCIFNKPQL